jgi:hypothetical protein
LITAGSSLAAADRGAGQSAAGRVTGSVKLTLANSAPSSASAYERRSVGPRPKPLSELKNVVIFFSDLPATKPAPMQASIAQKGRAVRAASRRGHRRVERGVPQRGSVLPQRVLAVSWRRVQPGRYPSGSSRSKTFNRAGIIKVFCEIHSHMSAVIRVFDHGWFTVPNGRRHILDR